MRGGAALVTAGLVLAGCSSTVQGAGSPARPDGRQTYASVQDLYDDIVQGGTTCANLTPRSAMVLGAWLDAFGVGAGLVLAERDLARLRVPAIAYTAFGVYQLAVVLVHGRQMDAARWPYAFVLAAVVVTGAYGWWATRSDRCRNAAGSSDRVGMHSFWKTCVRWVSTVRRVT